MVRQIPIAQFLEQAVHSTVIDVRAPCEFADGHILGAKNVPLFDDDERAKIGTCYKVDGRDEAVLLGLEIVGPKMRSIVESVRAVTDQPNPLLHCWRGGMRSSSVAWLLEQAGMEPLVLEGGYKSYRRLVHATLEADRKIIVLAGMTGAGKTTLLDELSAAGEQVLDLERLAHHRGSSFGSIGLPPQPTCEQFENRIFQCLTQLDSQRPVWIEDESPSIGKVRVPNELWGRMRDAPAIFVDLPRSVRAKNLADVYGDLDTNELCEAITRLTKKIGGHVVREMIADVEAGKMQEVAFGLLDYYDKTYQHAADKRPRKDVFRLPGEVSVDRILEFSRSHCA